MGKGEQEKNALGASKKGNKVNQQREREKEIGVQRGFRKKGKERKKGNTDGIE